MLLPLNQLSNYHFPKKTKAQEETPVDSRHCSLHWGHSSEQNAQKLSSNGASTSPAPKPSSEWAGAVETLFWHSVIKGPEDWKPELLDLCPGNCLTLDKSVKKLLIRLH